MSKEITLEQLTEAIETPRSRRVKINYAKSADLNFESANEIFELKTLPESYNLGPIDFAKSSFDAFRSLASNYFKSPISGICVSGLRVNPLIDILKKSGDLYSIYDWIYFGDKANSLLLFLKNKESEIFIWTEDLKYLSKKWSSRVVKLCNESDFIGEHLPYASSIHLFFKTGDDLAHKIATKLSSNCSLEEEEAESSIEMVVMGPHGLSLRSVKLETPQGFDLSLHYGEDFPVYNEKLLDRLSSKSKGIVMLHGPPGTGKTHYIRSVIPKLVEMGKGVVLIPKHVISSLESPQFNSFMIEHFSDRSIVFVIEDAESIISKRDAAGGHRSELVSTILNITDGILNDIFNIQVILTFNTELSSIDEALLRKGRLISKYEFSPLSRPQAQRLAQSLGYNLTSTTSKFTLAEIYSLGESEEDDILINQNLSKQKTFVGF